MKILYITNYLKIAAASGGFINDYQNDLLFFGLWELLGSDIIDSVPIISLYRENQDKIDPRRLWGGFTTFWLIDKDIVDRNHIEEKIKNKYFDLVIYGSIRRCNDYYDLVSRIYESKKIILVDGNDDQNILALHRKHPYFKRELIGSYENVLPISFAMPTPKITNVRNKNKFKGFGDILPGLHDTYTFKSEKSYYADYNNSFFGMTTRKAGWDCMRHYEILANYCIPCFINISNCPKETLTVLPKNLIIQGMELLNNSFVDNVKYYSILDQLFEYTQNHLTTKHLAQRLLESVL